MIRVIAYLVPVFLVALGLAWLADRPGDMVVTFAGYRYQVSLMVAAVALVAVVAIIMIGWWLVRSIWNSPHTVARYFRVRRRDRGYQALSTGMIAAGSGDAALARKKNREAMKLINADQEPLIALLDAQTSLLEGDHQAAREKFKAMLADPEMRVLGLRGLYLEAERLGERQAARHYATQAAEIAPQLSWAAESTLEERVEQNDWDGALRLLEAQKGNRQVDREKLSRRKAVILTARAMSVLDADPLSARNAAQEALRLVPDFVPAALVAARALIRQNDLKKAARILESAWKKDPHPQVADLYIHARAGDSVADRLGRARRLEALRNHNPEAIYWVARAALEAGNQKLARKSAEETIRQDPRERAFMLMADIEEAETGEQGRVRQWLARALRAPRDAAWVADGYVSDRWAPFSPVTGRIDAFEWKTPVERVAQMIEHDADGKPVPLESLPMIAAQVADQKPAPVIDAAPARPAAAPAPTPAPAPVPAPPANPATAQDQHSRPATDTPAKAASARPAEPAKAPAAPAAPIVAATPIAAPPPPSNASATQATRASTMPSSRRDAEKPTGEVVMFHRPPDDPGVDETAASPADQRAKLF